MVKIVNLLEAEPGRYIILDIDWTDRFVGKYIQARDIIVGSSVTKDSKGQIIFDGIVQSFNENHLTAMKAVKAEDFSKLKIVY
jgi:hypothetical protein